MRKFYLGKILFTSFTSLSVLFVNILSVNAEEVKAELKAGVDFVFDPHLSRGRQKPENKFVLGKNTAEAGGEKKECEKKTGEYKDFAGQAISCNTGVAKEKTTTAQASTNISISPPPGDKQLYPWQLSGFAKASRTKPEDPGASAKGILEDPQFFEPEVLSPEPLLEEAISIEQGTSIFTDTELGSAFARFERTTSLLEDPIFSIEIFSIAPSLVDAIVTFNSDPSLEFSITEQDLETLLEAPSSGLGTFGGLVNDILFSYEWDLSGFSITFDDSIGGDAEVLANLASVPEPTSTVSLLALGTLGAASTLKRKLKPSKFKQSKK